MNFDMLPPVYDPQWYLRPGAVARDISPSPPDSPYVPGPGSPQYPVPGSPQYSPPRSPRSPELSPDRDYVREVRRRLGDNYLVMPARMPGPHYSPERSLPGSPPSSPRRPQYSPPRTPAYSFRRAPARGAAGAAAGASGAAAGESGAAAGAGGAAAGAAAQERLEAWKSVGEDVADFCCAISGELMREPVVIGDGRSYEKRVIDEWFSTLKRESKPLTSPLTRAQVSGELQENLNLKNVIARAVEEKLAELRKRKRED